MRVLVGMRRAAPIMRCTVLAAALASVFSAANASEVAANVVLEALNSEKKALAEVVASGGVDLLAVAGRATPRDVATSNMGHLEEEDALAANVLDKSGLSETAHILRASGANAWSEFNKAKADGGAQWRCLAEALYFEARGEGLSGQVAVAEVAELLVVGPRRPDRRRGFPGRSGPERRP